MASEYPLSLIIKAVDKATAPLRAINAKLQKFTAPVRRLNNAFRALSDEAGLPRLVKGFGGVGRAVSNVGQEALALGAKIGALSLGAAYALHRIVRGAVDAGDELATVADRVGLSVDAFAQLQYAAAQADVEQEQFSAAMDQFNKRLGEAKAGSGSLLAFLQKVAPALALQVRGAKSTEAALELMTGAFEKVTDPARRAALANAAFGRSGLQMGQFLGEGTKAIRERRKRFRELAGSQEAFARGAGALDNTLRETETAFLGLRTAAAGELFPALTQLARAVTGIIAGNRGKLAAWAREAGEAISGWVKGGGLERLVATMREWARIIGTVVDGVGGLKNVLIIAGAYMSRGFLGSLLGVMGFLAKLGGAVLPFVIRGGMMLLPVLGKLFAAFMALNLANPVVWIVALGAALAGAAYLVWKHWEPIKQFFLDLWEKVKAIGSWFGGKLGIAGGPALGAAQAAPPPAGTQAGAAHVSIDFSNLPKGARVTADPKSTADLDLGLGYALVSP